jgi:hypothetical protein
MESIQRMGYPLRSVCFPASNDFQIMCPSNI